MTDRIVIKQNIHHKLKSILKHTHDIINTVPLDAIGWYGKDRILKKFGEFKIVPETALGWVDKNNGCHPFEYNMPDLNELPKEAIGWYNGGGTVFLFGMDRTLPAHAVGWVDKNMVRTQFKKVTGWIGYDGNYHSLGTSELPTTATRWCTKICGYYDEQPMN
jgi:hypothetical protein